MKRSITKYIFTTFVFGSFIVFAQGQRTTPSQYSGTVTRNYVRTWDATAPEANPATLMTKDLRDVKQTTTYFDGLGRQLQVVVKKGSQATGSSATDLVSSSEYDQFGNEIYKNLLYAEPSLNDGLFKLNPFTPQVSFYNSQLNGQAGETNLGANNLNWAYSKTIFEPSPLNRVTDAYAPGANWIGSEGMGSPHPKQIKYHFNTVTDDVKILNVTDVTDSWGTYAIKPSSPTPNYYPAGTVNKSITVDEHGKQVIELKDKSGRVILKKVQLTATADDGNGSGYTGWLCTYYLYDALNNLRCVVQPRGVELLIGNSWAFTTTILDEQCFRYEYDERNRMVMKKVPGAGEVWMVYDAKDRLVLTQDANLRTGATVKWVYTLYDNLNRPIETGLWNNSQDRLYHKGQASSSSAYPNLSGQTYEQLSITGYDTYTTIPGASGLNSSFDNSYSTHFSTNYNSSPNYPQQQTSTGQTRGMVTWTQTKVLGSTTWLYAVSIYDEKGRVIQVKSKNQTGGTDIITTQYSWGGQPLVTVGKTENGSNSQIMVMVSQMTYDDLGRVTTIEKKQSNSQYNSGSMPASYTTIASMEYDALGQLKSKKVGSKKDPLTTYPYTYYSSRQHLEVLNYEYNVRGWILGMNRSYLREANDPLYNEKYFGFDLGYDKLVNVTGRNYFAGTQNGEFNGNINGMIWKSKGDQVRRKYDFEYDAMSRLLKGDFEQDNNSTSWDNSIVNYNMQMGNSTDPTTAYDANGNIMAMKQWGLKLASSPVIDEFAYTYKNSGSSNKLLAVTESAAINTTDNKLGDFTDLNRTLDDYDYDVNGNLIYDKNKSIASITYNHLNLPLVITVTGKGTITYTYDADGSKLKKITTETNASVVYNGSNYTTEIITTTSYLGILIYESKSYGDGTLNTALGYTNKLQFASHEEGRLRALYNNVASPTTITGLEYDYFIKDHLGNVRMVLTEEIKKDKYPVASFEDAKVNTEDDYYTIDHSKIVLGSSVTGLSTYYNDNGIGNNPSDPTFEAANSTELYKLKSTENKTGLGITLKVMAGDKIDIHGKSYYFENNTGGSGS